jgi:hypothetical protein
MIVDETVVDRGAGMTAQVASTQVHFVLVYGKGGMRHAERQWKVIHSSPTAGTIRCVECVRVDGRGRQTSVKASRDHQVSSTNHSPLRFTNEDWIGWQRFPFSKKLSNDCHCELGRQNGPLAEHSIVHHHNHFTIQKTRTTGTAPQTEDESAALLLAVRRILPSIDLGSNSSSNKRIDLMVHFSLLDFVVIV